MSNGLSLVSSILGFSVLSVVIALGQQQKSEEGVRKAIEEREKQQMVRTRDEKKLEGPLYQLLLLAEQSDTSKEKKRQFAKFLRAEKNLHADPQNRISVIAELNSSSETTEVKNRILELGGQIQNVGVVPYVRFMIPVKHLRGLLSMPAIFRIKTALEGGYR